MCLTANPAPATAHEVEPPPVVSEHRLTIDGTTLEYTAEVGRLPIRGVKTDEPHAYMFYTAYRVATQGKPRPVMFLWGGGPGGWSLNMNFEFAGPLRADGPHLSDGRDLIPNPQTLLTDADLVFVDQVGTGYSRPTKPQYVSEFQNTIADTNSFTEFIRLWRVRHDAEDTPIYVGGLSWGAPRAATVSYALLDRGLPVHGAVLIGGETSLNSRSDYVSGLMFEALRVVGMSHVAFYHGRLAPDVGSTPEAVAEAADTWVRDTYVPALSRRDQLSNEERDAIVGGLSRFTGVASSRIDRETLIINPRQFRQNVLGDGKTLYGSDVRRVERYQANYVETALQHIEQDLGYRTDLTYRQIGEPDIGYSPTSRTASPMEMPWDFATSPVPSEEAKALLQAALERGAGPPIIGEPLPATAEAIELNPEMKVLVVIGRYDGESTCPSNAAVERNLPAHLAQSMIFRCYNAGHSPWRGADAPAVLQQLSDDIKALIHETQ